MAIQQAAAAAAISYAVEYFGGYEPTVLRSALAGACGAADYYTKAKLAGEGDDKSFFLSILNSQKSNPSYYGAIGGPLAGGLLYGALNSYSGAGTLTSGFMRGAFYAWSSDMLMQQVSSKFNGNKLMPTVFAGIIQKQTMVELMPPPSETKPSL